MALLWVENEHWQRACSNFRGEINNKCPKSNRLQLIEIANSILPHIVKGTPFSGTSTFYTDANESGKVDYKSEKNN